MITPQHLARSRSIAGWLLHEWFERNLEFAMAGATIINGRAALFTTADGKSIAPYLSSALSGLSLQPYWWAAGLALVGVLHMIIVLGSFGSERVGWRLFATLLTLAAYVVVSAAIVTGPPPPQSAERYVWTAGLAFWLFVYLLAEWRAGNKVRKAQ